MNKDFRVSVDFFAHHKAKKLRKRLGSGALLSLLQLWAYAAKIRTDGNLTGMSAEDIELAAEWEGDDGAFAHALEEVGFLDVRRTSDERQTNVNESRTFVNERQTDVNGRSTFFDASEIRLHDWEENNQWAAGSSNRGDQARFARLAKINRKAFDELKTQGVTAISKNDYSMLTNVKRTSDERQTDVNAALTPAPSPDPAPIAKEKDSKTPPNPPKGDDEAVPLAFAEWWRAYPKKVGQKAALKAWKKAKGKPPLPVLLAAVEKQKTWAQWQRDGGQYIPNPSTWLNQGRWNDEPPEAQSRASPADRVGFGRHSGAQNYGDSDFGAFGGGA
jgi:hypothetical protein